MSTPNDGGPAFPQHGWTSNPEVLERMKNQGGMSLRDWFAGQALLGMVSDPQLSGSCIDYALAAYEYADAMLKARGQ